MKRIIHTLTNRTVIILIAAMHFSFAAMGTGQEPAQKKGSTGQDRAKSSVPGVQPLLMPDFTTGEFTFETARRKLIDEYRQERITYPPPSGPSDIQAGRIFNQDPAPRTPLKPNTVITLFVSNGPQSVVPTTPTADISVSKTLDEKPEYWVGESVRYTIVVSNSGPSRATNVQITDTPTKLDNLKFDSNSGECIRSTCSINSIEAGSSATITVTATIADNGNFTNVVKVTANEFDPKRDNNTSEDNSAEANSSADVSATQQLVSGGPFSPRPKSSVHNRHL